jgi:hypothetical protein
MFRVCGGLARTPVVWCLRCPEGTPPNEPLPPKPSPRVRLNTACRFTIALTARVSCNSLPPALATERRYPYPHASEGVEKLRCSGGLRPRLSKLAEAPWGLRPWLCGKALPFRPRSPKYYCFPPREGCAFTRRKTGCIKTGAFGKAQPFRIASGGAAARIPSRES